MTHGDGDSDSNGDNDEQEEEENNLWISSTRFARPTTKNRLGFYQFVVVLVPLFTARKLSPFPLYKS